MLLWDIPQTLWIYCGHLCSWIYIAFLFEYFLSLIFKARVTHFHLSRLEYFETLIWRSGLHNVNILASIQSSNDAYFHLIVISSAGSIQQTMPRVFFLHGQFNGCLCFFTLGQNKEPVLDRGPKPAGCLKKWVLPNWASGDPDAVSWEEILMMFMANLQMLNSVKLSFLRHPVSFVVMWVFMFLYLSFYISIRQSDIL